MEKKLQRVKDWRKWWGLYEAFKKNSTIRGWDNSPFEGGWGMFLIIRILQMTRNNILPYNPKLKELAKQLRKNSTLSEVLLWGKIKGKIFGVEFHRQIPIDEYIVDFFCHEIRLAIEIDGSSHDQKYEYDLIRNERLTCLGVTIIHFNDIDVKRDMNNVVRAIESKVVELSNIPLPPSKGDLTTSSETFKHNLSFN
jgi:very-short-patch-repair endonuclease